MENSQQAGAAQIGANPNVQRPSVGRAVHYYSKSIPGVRPDQADFGLNGQGFGPYPATVLQVTPSGDYLNLRVIGWGQTWDEGSVAEKGSALASPDRYWEWPSRS